MSYHDAIRALLTPSELKAHEAMFAVAHAIELQRSLVYSQTETIDFTPEEKALISSARQDLNMLRRFAAQMDPFEFEWFEAMSYKMARVANHTRLREKAADDVTDSFNYAALLCERWAHGKGMAEVHSLTRNSPPVVSLLRFYSTCATLFSLWTTAGVVTKTSEELIAEAAAPQHGRLFGSLDDGMGRH